MARAVADLEAIREGLGIDRWVAPGHSWGSELAVRYAVEHPDRVAGLVGVCGRGPQRDRTWSEQYELGAARERELGQVVEIPFAADVHAALGHAFTDWTQQPDLWRCLADCPVPMRFVVAADDIRPYWPIRQLAHLVPEATCTVVPGVAHDFWSTHPQTWRSTVEEALASLAPASGAAG